ncbi:MAG TPA: VIT and VWA domain-containing protein [Pyrinomonadaceae bacterium]
MYAKLLRKFPIALLALTAFFFVQVNVVAQTRPTAGSLTVLNAKGAAASLCPLKHTDVKAEISGFISRVRVTQEFENSFKEKIEAVYTFPLPQDAAVDDMIMTIGTRTIRGKILPREEAQAVYDSAKSNGQVASLLDQERPNIFTQSVANILPGEQIKIEISYVETLKYEDGAYEFVFPMVVGPRYIPSAPAVQKQGLAPNTDQLPDASRITPRMVPPTMRSGHDISLDIQLDAGLIVDGLTSKTHDVDIERADPRSAHIHLKDITTIPNKDFVLRYDVAGGSIQDALLTHRSEKGGFFTMMLQPPDRVTVEDVTPKELVFVLDTSGSMEGFPIEKAKETMKLALNSLNPSDTFNLITFAGDTDILFPKPVPATKENMAKAQLFLKGRGGSGGTEMMTAIKAALEPSDKQDHLRIVCFMTDGYVGNDMEIVSEVQKHPNARVFAFGIGDSVNRFLLDKMAEAGRGEVEYVSLNDDGSAAARRFHQRVRNPLLTDISIDWNGLPVADVYPQRIPDLFSAKPVILSGRFTAAASGTIRLKGKIAGNDFVREIPVSFPENMAAHDVLSSLWARRRIDDLMSKDYSGAQNGQMQPELQQTITAVGLEYRLMTQFTSFVAVEEMIVTEGGQPRRIDVPVETPSGVNPAMVGAESESFSTGFIGTVAKSGTGGGFGSGRVVARRKLMAPAPPPNIAPSVSVSASVAPSVLSGMVVADAAASPTPLPIKSEEERRVDQVRPKLHPAVLAIVQRLLNKQGATTADEARFVRDGKAEVQIWLLDKSAGSMAKLKELGVEVMLDQPNSKLVIGRLSIDKLEQLADLKFVRYVSPQM